jgi:hypothetical protein
LCISFDLRKEINVKYTKTSVEVIMKVLTLKVSGLRIQLSG